MPKVDESAASASARPGSPRVRRRNQPRWITITLLLAGLYNIAWGTFVVVLPLAAFRWAGMLPPNYPELWQCIGMIVGVYGLGYAIAAQDAARHWPIVLVGLLGKLFGPIGFLRSALSGRLPWVAGWVNIWNNLIWIVPFTLILVWAYRVESGREEEREGERLLAAIRDASD